MKNTEIFKGIEWIKKGIDTINKGLQFLEKNLMEEKRIFFEINDNFK